MNRRRAPGKVALTVFLGAISTAAAQTAGGPTDCVQIDNDLDRLACYDDAAGRTPETRPIEGTGDWDVTEGVSRLDDSTTIMLTLESAEWSNCWPDNNPHVLFLRCKENTTSAFMTFGGCFMSDLQGHGRVQYRIDREPAGTKSMLSSTDNEALGLWHGRRSIPFIKEMFGRQELFVRAVPFNESPVTATYNISGIEEAIEPLREACNW